jgi:endo-1,4-beta-D-glucanase Y
MNSDVIAFYEGWKKEYIKKTVTTSGGYILATSGGTNAKEEAITVSEGHGYGMLTTVLMAGYDKYAQEIFDGFYKIFRIYPSDIDKDLMTWQILGKIDSHESLDLASSATDGDFDIAYALVLADRQWGSDGEINYLAEAKKVIDAIGRNNVHPELKRILLGDWVEEGNKFSIATRSSDWVPSHFRLFGEVSGNSIWGDVLDTSYSILFKVQDDNTGLIPDFAISDPVVAASPNFLETEKDGHFSSNACRDPWRLALDSYHYGSDESKKALTPLLSWIDKKTDGDLSKMDNGYSLDGIADWPVDEWGTWGAYSAPMMVAAAIDPKFKKMLNSGWKHNSKFSTEVGYYGNSIRLLSLLAVSGNWWNPGK